MQTPNALGGAMAEIRVRGPRPRATRVTSLNPWELAVLNAGRTVNIVLPWCPLF